MVDKRRKGEPRLEHDPRTPKDMDPPRCQRADHNSQTQQASQFYGSGDAQRQYGQNAPLRWSEISPQRKHHHSRDGMHRRKAQSA